MTNWPLVQLPAPHHTADASPATPTNAGSPIAPRKAAKTNTPNHGSEPRTRQGSFVLWINARYKDEDTRTWVVPEKKN
jgi:hypothetical protein